VQVVTLPGHGSLPDNGVAVSAGQSVLVADILAGKLKFAPAHDANGNNYAHFTFQVQDGGGTANGGIDLDPTPNTLTINVTPVSDVTTITGTPHVDVLHGTGGADIIKGLGGNDTIYGHSGDDRIIGGRGADLLIGGAGHDTFVFTSIYDSAPNQSGIVNNGFYSPISGLGQRDIVTDFTHGQDKIDLSAIDANTQAAGNQAFAWRGQGIFTHTPGQLIEKIYDQPGTKGDQTIIYGDINGDARADFQIELVGLKHLVASDFVL
jgi:Ca2+-binding RTX toxin-like protein